MAMRAAAVMLACAAASGCGGGTLDLALLYDPISCGCDFDEVDLIDGADAILIVFDGAQRETDFACAAGASLDQLAAALDAELDDLAPLATDEVAFDLVIFAPPAVDLDVCEADAAPVMFGFSDVVELSGDAEVPIPVECDPSPAAFCP